MPFETGAAPRRRIAVIGAGISGMGAARELADTHDVTLIETEPRLGGHARTILAGKRGDQPVDTGFIVFNHANYPELARLFDRLDVPVVKSDMSFGVSCLDGRFEYALSDLGAVFAQRRRAFDPRFLRMLRDIFRFNARAVAMSRTDGARQTIGEFLDRMGTGPWFRDRYLLPLTSAIWSTPSRQILEFPAQAMIRFMENHALLGARGQHQWYTVQGGSVAYVERLGRALTRAGVTVRTGAPVAGLRRDSAGCELHVEGGEWQRFDEVVLATHSDTALTLLSDATPQERADLGAIRYQPNDIMLHADPSVMPRRRNVWSSWNYTGTPARRDGQIDMTYWMNRLQPIPEDDPMFVTLNTTRPIRDELVYDQVTLHHPVYDLEALAAQDRLHARNGTHNTWFCGAWMANGFHEDGLVSGLTVARAIAARDSMPVAAE